MIHFETEYQNPSKVFLIRQKCSFSQYFANVARYLSYTYMYAKLGLTLIH